MKVYVVLYHDPYEHSECEETCCGVQTSRVLAVRLSQEAAKEAIADIMTRICYEKDAFEIEEWDTEQKGST